MFSRKRLLCLSRRLIPLSNWSAGVRRPLIPIDQFVLKVHSRCDLACDHCYVYEAADQSWRGRPVVISDDVISRTAQRTAQADHLHQEPPAGDGRERASGGEETRAQR